MKLNSKFVKELKDALVKLHDVSDSEFDKVLKRLNLDRVRNELFVKLQDDALFLKSYTEFEKELLRTFRLYEQKLSKVDIQDFLSLVSSVLRLDEYHDFKESQNILSKAQYLKSLCESIIQTKKLDS